MMRWSEGVGRTSVIAAIAATIFVTFLAVAPRSSTATSTPTLELVVIGADQQAGLGIDMTAAIDGRGQSTVDAVAVELGFGLVNRSGSDLAGIYLFLDGQGPAACDAHLLAPGAAARCTITVALPLGATRGHAWATAWSFDSRVTAPIDFVVGISG